jgi:hypothetical protein
MAERGQHDDAAALQTSSEHVQRGGIYGVSQFAAIESHRAPDPVQP